MRPNFLAVRKSIVLTSFLAITLGGCRSTAPNDDSGSQVKGETISGINLQLNEVNVAGQTIHSWNKTWVPGDSSRTATIQKCVNKVRQHMRSVLTDLPTSVKNLQRKRLEKTTAESRSRKYVNLIFYGYGLDSTGRQGSQNNAGIWLWLSGAGNFYVKWQYSIDSEGNCTMPLTEDLDAWAKTCTDNIDRWNENSSDRSSLRCSMVSEGQVINVN